MTIGAGVQELAVVVAAPSENVIGKGTEMFIVDNTMTVLFMVRQRIVKTC